MFTVQKYSSDLDLNSFFVEAEKRGFVNNSSKKVLVDCFRNEEKKQVWILYYNNNPIGSVAAHSFYDVMGKQSYRIAARTCVLTNLIENHPYNNSLRTKSVITNHQNPTAQFLIPTCIQWVPTDSYTYITTNKLTHGTQSKVDRIFAPLMEKKGIMKRIKEIEYRNTIQTVWSFDNEKFMKDLAMYPRWS